jgi:hypothetical protein
MFGKQNRNVPIGDVQDFRGLCDRPELGDWSAAIAGANGRRHRV